MGQKNCNRSEYSQKSNFEVTKIRVIECPWKKVGILVCMVSLALHKKPWRASVHGKLWRHVEDYYA
jgi:hypothetical protein